MVQSSMTSQPPAVLRRSWFSSLLAGAADGYVMAFDLATNLAAQPVEAAADGMTGAVT